jgi:hypothetical protein
MRKLALHTGVLLLLFFGLYRTLIMESKPVVDPAIRLRFETMQIPEGGPSPEALIIRYQQWFDEAGNMYQFNQWDARLDPYVFKDSKLDSLRKTTNHQMLLRAGDRSTW